MEIEPVLNAKVLIIYKIMNAYPVIKFLIVKPVTKKRIYLIVSNVNQVMDYHNKTVFFVMKYLIVKSVILRIKIKFVQNVNKIIL